MFLQKAISVFIDDKSLIFGSRSKQSSHYHYTGIALSFSDCHRIDYFKGIQMALSTYTKETTGIQIAISHESGDHTGLQSLALKGYAEKMNGLQLNFGNFAGFLKGIQAGLINVVFDKLVGLQTGVVNLSFAGIGIQIGLFNATQHYFKGLQIGLLNYMGCNRVLKYLPLINWRLREPQPEVLREIERRIEEEDYPMGRP